MIYRPKQPAPLSKGGTWRDLVDFLAFWLLVVGVSIVVGSCILLFWGKG